MRNWLGRLRWMNTCLRRIKVINDRHIHSLALNGRHELIVLYRCGRVHLFLDLCDFVDNVLSGKLHKLINISALRSLFCYLILDSFSNNFSLCLPLLFPLFLLLLLLFNDSISLQLFCLILILEVSILKLSGLILLYKLPLSLFFFTLLNFLGFSKITCLLLSLPLALPSHGIDLSYPFSFLLLCPDSCLYVVLLFQLDPPLLLLLCLIHLP